MTNRAELVEQIRFALSNLSARNGHHEFEALCFEVARVNVTPNLVPATGPVAGRGDQGRDFESFRSTTSVSLGPTGMRLGLDPRDLVAFACTLQRDDVRRKVMSDIEAICSAGEPVAAVVVYCEANLPVAERHRIQADARSQWDVTVEVIDGQGLADQLAEPALFWAATRYLSIPSELTPQTAGPTDYGELIQRWRDRAEPPNSFGDLLALQEGLRAATFDRHLRGDVPFWLSRMRMLLGAPGMEIRARARYETILGTLRGLGNLRGSDNTDLVRGVIEDALSSDDESGVTDATVVLLMAVGAFHIRAIDVDAGTLMSWNERLREHVSALVEDAVYGRRAALLDALGQLRLQPDITGATQGEAQSVDIDALMAMMDEGPSIESGRAARLVDSVGAVAAWLDLARDLPTNWLYPVDGLSQRISLIAPLISREDGYDELTRLVDDAVARRSGRSAVAERCRDRAFAHVKAGRILDAVAEFHRARVDWLSGDTLRGSLLAQQFVAHCYLTLNLNLAARYFWLAAAYLASRDRELGDLVPPSLCGASTADYHAGAWFGALDLASLALRTQSHFADDPWDFDRYDYLSGTFFDITMIDAYAQRLGGRAAEAAERVVTGFGMRDFLDEMVPPDPWWTSMSTEQHGAHISGELGHPGFADGGPLRSISWRALGLDWDILVPNSYDEVTAAERLGSVLQIGAAELARSELLIAPSRIRIRLRLRANGREESAHLVSTADGVREWDVETLAPSPEIDAVRAFAEAIEVLLTILGDVSLLPRADLDQLVHTALGAGLVERFAPMLLYDHVNPVTEERFAASARDEAADAPRGEVRAREHAELAWRAEPGPGYTPEEGIARVEHRYEKYRELLPHSIPALMADEGVRAVCDELRGQGWKDWHLLQALLNMVLSYRINEAHPRSWQDADRIGEQVANHTETGDEPRPTPDTVTAASMAEALRMSMLSTLKTWDLTLRQQAPDFAALERLLAERYGFWADDAPHEIWWRGREVS